MRILYIIIRKLYSHIQNWKKTKSASVTETACEWVRETRAPVWAACAPKQPNDANFEQDWSSRGLSCATRRQRSPRETVRDRTDWAAAGSNNRRLTDSLSFSSLPALPAELWLGRERKRWTESKIERVLGRDRESSRVRGGAGRAHRRGCHINKQVLLAFVASLIHDFNF